MTAETTVEVREVGIGADDRMTTPNAANGAAIAAPETRMPQSRSARRSLPAVVALSLAVAAPTAFAAAPIAHAATPAAAPGSGGTGWRWTPEVIVDTVEAEKVAISPDGRRVVYAATRPRPATASPGEAYANLWMVPAKGGTPRRLTSADARDEAPAWSPDGAAIAFLSARGGDKAKVRLWVMPADGGEPSPLTTEKDEIESFAWSFDGRRIAYVAVDPKSEAREADEKAGRDAKVAGRNERPRRLFVVDVATRAALPVAALGERSAWQFAWAPEGGALVATVTDTPRTDDSYLKKRIVVLPLAEAAREREIAPVVGKVDEVIWSRDGATIVWRGGVDRSDPTSGSIFVAPAGGGAAVNLTGDRAETVRDIVHVGSGTLAAVAVRGTRTALIAIDYGAPGWPAPAPAAAGGARRDLLPAGTLAFTAASASADGARFALSGSTPAGPAEVHLVDRKGARRLTDLNQQLAGLPRGRQEVVRWRASDGLEIEGVLVRPTGDAQRESYPLVVIVHGGPEYEDHEGWATSYNEPVQALAERGFFVLRPNYRGSAGRGVVFAKADHGDLGGREFQDVVDGIDALGPRFRIDPARVGMTGGSYGGYFTNLAATRWSGRFAAAVSLYGIANWMSFLGQSDIPGENSEVHWALWCYDHQETCRQASPVTHVGAAATPTLILQGEDDLRVPKAQSDEMYAALKWRDVPVEYVVFPREKHGFDERKHQLETCRRVLDWFTRYLKP
jgi:dipeptidyl aminopeptidase/acylaminoacyl peptidase